MCFCGCWACCFLFTGTLVKEGAGDILARFSPSLGRVLLVNCRTLLGWGFLEVYASLHVLNSLVGSITHPGTGLVFHYRNRWLENSKNRKSVKIIIYFSSYLWFIFSWIPQFFFLSFFAVLVWCHIRLAGFLWLLLVANIYFKYHQWELPFMSVTRSREWKAGTSR